MPVRKVAGRGHSATGKFPSLKLGRMVQFESLLELDFIHLLEYDPTVTRYEEQPLTIEYQYGKKTLRYTPDFHVVHSETHTLVECKPDKFVDTDENRRKFSAAEAWCAERDWRFQVATAATIRGGNRLQNIKFLYQFARREVTPSIRARLYAELLVASQLSLSVLAAAIDPSHPADGLIALYHLAYRGELALSLDAPLTPDTPVTLRRAI